MSAPASLSAHAKLVYLSLSSRANAEMQALPSHRTIADDSGLSVSSVKRALGVLRDRGLISWARRTAPNGGGIASIYTIGRDPQPLDGSPGTQRVGVSTAARIAGVHIDTIRRASDAGRLRTWRTPGGHRRFDPHDVRALSEGGNR